MVVAALGLAFLIILLWPITTLWRLIRVGNPFRDAIRQQGDGLLQIYRIAHRLVLSPLRLPTSVPV